MPTLNTHLFQANEYGLQIYNGFPVIDYAFRFFTVLECPDIPYEEIDFDFPDYTGSFFRVYNDRGSRLLLDVDMEQSGTYLILNLSAADATFDDNGDYYYEIGYVRGVYEQVLRYGKLSVI